MPRNFVKVLAYSCAGLFALYLALVAFAIYFASVETHLSGQMGEMEAFVSELEADYYDAITLLSAKDPYALGFTDPQGVEYVSAGTPNLSFVRTDVRP